MHLPISWLLHWHWRNRKLSLCSELTLRDMGNNKLYQTRTQVENANAVHKSWGVLFIMVAKVKPRWPFCDLWILLMSCDHQKFIMKLTLREKTDPPITKKTYGLSSYRLLSSIVCLMVVTRQLGCVLWSMQHYCHGRVIVVVADDLAPVWRQGICNPYVDRHISGRYVQKHCSQRNVGFWSYGHACWWLSTSRWYGICSHIGNKGPHRCKTSI